MADARPNAPSVQSKLDGRPESGEAGGGGPGSPLLAAAVAAPSAMPMPLTGARPVTHPDPTGMPPPEVKVAREWLVFCDGGEGALGHPRVFYSIPHDAGWIDCGYCDARFVHESRLTGHRAGDRTSGGDHSQPADLSADVRGPQPGRAPPA